jgi:hypothetical protein
MTGDWRDFRPAIWLAMLGVAVMIIVTPHYIGAFFLGGAIGLAIRVRQRRIRQRQSRQRRAGERGASQRRRR